MRRCRWKCAWPNAKRSNAPSLTWCQGKEGLNAAPTPSQDSADVIAVFSDAYTSIANNLNPNWGQQTNATEIQIDGNNILKYENLNYQGLDYPQTDVSSMEYVHLDYKTADASSIEFSLISANPTIDTPYSITLSQEAGKVLTSHCLYILPI